MKIQVNGQEKDVPFFLIIIKMRQYLEYYERYGEKLQKNPDLDPEKQLDNEALSWYSYWTACDFFEVRNEPFVQPIYFQYRTLKQFLSDKDYWVDLNVETEWNDEIWSIRDFKKSSNVEELSYDDIRMSRHVILLIHHIKRNRWKHLPRLCAIYFRRKGEELWDYDLDERIEMMMDLPMNIAMSLALILQGSEIENEVKLKDIEEPVILN